MALTDTSIKSAKPAEKPVKMTDGDGLYLLIHPNGGKWWRFDYIAPPIAVEGSSLGKCNRGGDRCVGPCDPQPAA